MIEKLIVICTGNICRSPIAEELFRLGKPGMDVRSAGIAALVNHPADPLAQLVMREHGHDLSAHRAQQATPALLMAMDLILTMDGSHSDWIRGRFPQLLGRTHKLGRWANNTDIADPYRQPKAAFEHAYADIDRGVAEWLKRV